MLDCWLLQLITALGFHFRLIDGNYDHRWKILCQQRPISFNAKTSSAINRSYFRQLQCTFPVRFPSLRFESHVHKAKKSEQLKILADLAKPGGVWLDCRGKQTGGETVCLNNWSLPSQQRSSSIGSWCSSLQIKPSFTNWSDDSGWARGRRVWVWGGGKVPEEPLAFTLPSLIQVVLLVALLACSLVVVILFQVPHRWPAMLLKVLLVLCIRIICLRYCKGSNVQDKSCQMFF